MFRELPARVADYFCCGPLESVVCCVYTATFSLRMHAQERKLGAGPLPILPKGELPFLQCVHCSRVIRAAAGVWSILRWERGPIECVLQQRRGISTGACSNRVCVTIECVLCPIKCAFGRIV